MFLNRVKLYNITKKLLILVFVIQYQTIIYAHTYVYIVEINLIKSNYSFLTNMNAVMKKNIINKYYNLYQKSSINEVQKIIVYL